MFKTWKALIEGTASDLSLMADFECSDINFFKKGRLAYFRNDVEALKKTYEYFDQKKEESNFYKLCAEIFKNRLWVREFKGEKSGLEFFDLSNFRTEDLVEKTLFVELLAVEAIVCDLNKDYDLCYSKNMKAFKIAEEIGARVKSSILFYNGIVAMNHKAPVKVRLSKLSDSISMAEKCGDVTTEVAARTSLANEYKALGCGNHSCRELKKALKVVEANQYGSFNHAACLLSYAKSCVSLKRMELAKEALCLLETFEFQEMSKAISEVRSQIKSSTKVNSVVSLSGDEQKVIEVLVEGPKSKYDVIDFVYGEGDFESLDNRFKQVLARIRKKKGQVIVFNKVSSLYELVV